MFKKITGLVLGIALFTMCPLTAAAAPMVPAPYTADQLVDLSRAALAGVSSYHVDSVESTEFTYPATPQANFSYVETSQLTATPSCIYYQVVESVTTGGSTETKTVERYTSFEGNTLKEYTHNNNLPWGFRSRPVTQKGVTSFSMPDSFSLLKKNAARKTGAPKKPLFRFIQTESYISLPNRPPKDPHRLFILLMLLPCFLSQYMQNSRVHLRTISTVWSMSLPTICMITWQFRQK